MFDMTKHEQHVSELKEAQINIFLIYNVLAVALSMISIVLILALAF